MMISDMFKSFYPYFLPLVIYGIWLRVRDRKWCRAETLLLLLFGCHAILVMLQIVLAGGGFSRRYLLTGVPLLFGWAGYALHELASRKIFRLVVPVCLLLLFCDALRPSLEHLWKRNSKEELFVIRAFSPVIRRDWQGECAFYAPEILPHYYVSPKRPLVQCRRFPFLGYASGGSCQLPDLVSQPLPDYRIFENVPVEPPYTEIHREVFLNRTYRLGKRIR